MKDKRVKCPICGSLKTNEVSSKNNYCLDCGIEFNRNTQETFTIQFNGSLVKYYINEFMNCG